MTDPTPFNAARIQLTEDLQAMSYQVEEQLATAISALRDRNPALARVVLEREGAINELENRIEASGLQLLARFQPVAVDLRLIIMALKISTDLERIGDHAVNIAQRAVTLSGQPQLKPLIDIPLMAERAGRMLKGAVDAFTRRDAVGARAILDEDRVIDELRTRIFSELLTYMAADPGAIERAMQLILVAKDLERIADLATNIAEDVIFVVDGRIVRHGADAG